MKRSIITVFLLTLSAVLLLSCEEPIVTPGGNSSIDPVIPQTFLTGTFKSDDFLLGCIAGMDLANTELTLNGFNYSSRSEQKNGRLVEEENGSFTVNLTNNQFTRNGTVKSYASYQASTYPANNSSNLFLIDENYFSLDTYIYARTELTKEYPDIEKASLIGRYDGYDCHNSLTGSKLLIFQTSTDYIFKLYDDHLTLLNAGIIEGTKANLIFKTPTNNNVRDFWRRNAIVADDGIYYYGYFFKKKNSSLPNGTFISDDYLTGSISGMDLGNSTIVIDNGNYSVVSTKKSNSIVSEEVGSYNADYNSYTISFDCEQTSYTAYPPYNPYHRTYEQSFIPIDENYFSIFHYIYQREDLSTVYSEINLSDLPGEYDGFDGALCSTGMTLSISEENGEYRYVLYNDDGTKENSGPVKGTTASLIFMTPTNNNVRDYWRRHAIVHYDGIYFYGNFFVKR